MGHNPATLHVFKDVNKSPQRPFHNRCHGKRQEPNSWTDHLAPTRVASLATLDTYWNANSTHNVLKILAPKQENTKRCQENKSPKEQEKRIEEGNLH